MNSRLTFSFFGSSLTAASCSSTELFYRGLTRGLAGRGHRVTFYQPNLDNGRQIRAEPKPEWARVVTFRDTDESALDALESAEESNLIIKCSGVGAYDDLLEAAVLELKKPETLVAFLDMEPRATLDRLQKDPDDSFKALIPEFDFIFAHAATPAVVDDYTGAGAADCVSIYNALDPHTHFPVEPDPRFECDLALLCDCTTENESLVQEFLLKPAIQMPERKFLLAGNGWDEKPMPPNVKLHGSIAALDRNAFNCSPGAVLNIDTGRQQHGFSPPASFFEAAGTGACLILENREGIDQFLEPGREVIVIGNGDELMKQLQQLTPERAREVGRAARKRLLAGHTCLHRAEQLEKVFEAKAGRLVS